MDEFISLPNIIGYCGVALVLLAYFLLQKRTWRYNQPVYLLANMLGSVGIIVSLVEHWNWPSFIIQSCFIFISLYGLAKRHD